MLERVERERSGEAEVDSSNDFSLNPDYCLPIFNICVDVLKYLELKSESYCYTRILGCCLSMLSNFFFFNIQNMHIHSLNCFKQINGRMDTHNYAYRLCSLL